MSVPELIHTSHFTKMEHIFPLREISDERVQELLQHITPLVRNRKDDDALYEIELPEKLRTTAFTWDPTFTKRVDEASLIHLAVITTYHSCGYALLFKPDIAEVLAQIPTDLADQVAAFETLGENVEIINDTFYGHKTFTRLYRRE